MLTTPTGLRRPTYLLYPIEPGWPDPCRRQGSRGIAAAGAAATDEGRRPTHAAALSLWVAATTPLSDPLPPLAARPLRRPAPLSAPHAAPAGHRCMPRDRPLAARPARRHRRRLPRGQPGFGATPPLPRSPTCARRAWLQPRHGRGQSLPYHCRETSACRRQWGDLWRAAAPRRPL